MAAGANRELTKGEGEGEGGQSHLGAEGLAGGAGPGRQGGAVAEVMGMAWPRVGGHLAEWEGPGSLQDSTRASR